MINNYKITTTKIALKSTTKIVLKSFILGIERWKSVVNSIQHMAGPQAVK